MHGWGGENLDQSLAGDKEYHVLVRKAYNHLLAAPGAKEELTHEAMLKALVDANLIPNDARYEELRSDKESVDTVQTIAKRESMQNVAALPLIMAMCYLGLIIYFKKKGGYKPVELGSSDGQAAA